MEWASTSLAPLACLVSRGVLLLTINETCLYDTDGASGNYQNNEKGILTELTCSSFPLTVNVVSYAVEARYDYLEILDSTGNVIIRDPERV